MGRRPWGLACRRTGRQLTACTPSRPWLPAVLHTRHHQGLQGVPPAPAAVTTTQLKRAATSGPLGLATPLPDPSIS